MSHPAQPWRGSDPLRKAARERILAAALACAERGGLAAVGIAAVAREAGISRPTVYRYFGDRQELASQTLLRAGAGFASSLRAACAAADDAGAQAVEAVVLVVRGLPAHPVLGPAAADPTRAPRLTEAPVLAAARHALEPVVATAGWTEPEAREAVEVMVRFASSLLLSPAPQRNERALRAFCRRRLLPALGLA